MAKIPKPPMPSEIIDAHWADFLQDTRDNIPADKALSGFGPGTATDAFWVWYINNKLERSKDAPIHTETPE